MRDQTSSNCESGNPLSHPARRPIFNFRVSLSTFPPSLILPSRDASLPPTHFSLHSPFPCLLPVFLPRGGTNPMFPRRSPQRHPRRRYPPHPPLAILDSLC